MPKKAESAQVAEPTGDEKSGVGKADGEDAAQK